LSSHRGHNFRGGRDIGGLEISRGCQFDAAVFGAVEEPAVRMEGRSHFGRAERPRLGDQRDHSVGQILAGTSLAKSIDKVDELLVDSVFAHLVESETGRVVEYCGPDSRRR